MLPAEYRTMHEVELSHWWFRGRRRVLLDLLRQAMASEGDLLRVLDYGCGTGGNTQAYGALATVIGVEVDHAAIKLAQQRGGALYCCANGTQLPFGSGSFDLVVASDVLEHVENDIAAASEIARVLKPGGVAIVTVPAHQWLFSEHDVALLHFRRYSKVALRNLLQRSGFTIRRLSYWNMLLFPAIALHRLIKKPRALHPVHSDTRPASWMVNEALSLLLTAEAAIVRRMPLPWGVSLLTVAERL